MSGPTSHSMQATELGLPALKTTYCQVHGPALPWNGIHINPYTWFSK